MSFSGADAVELGPSPRRLRSLVYLSILPVFALLVTFGREYHWVEVAASAERDKYVAQAEGILAGRLPSDPFHPPLYPILAAGLATVFGNPFAMARLLSNLAAAGLLLCAFELGRKLRGDVTGAWALALTIVNPNLWIFGQQVTTDMLFACLAALTLLAGLSYLQRPSFGLAACAGVAYGVAAWTRSNAILLLPALVLAYYFARPADGDVRRSWRHCLLGAACALTLFLPLWLLRMHLFGDPFLDEAGRNLWWKLHANFDWSQLEHAPHTGMLSLLLDEPMPIALAGWREATRFAGSVLPRLLGGWIVFGVFAWALFRAVIRPQRTIAYLLFALGSFTGGVALVFFARERLMLVWLPVTAAMIFAQVETVAAHTRRPRLAVAAVGVLLTASVAARTVFVELPAFIEAHPYAEVAALLRVESHLADGDRLAGTAPFLGRYLRHAYVPIPDAFGIETRRPELYLHRLEEFLRAERVAYIVVGRAELRDRPDCLLGGEGTSDPPPWLALVQRDEEATLWKMAPSSGWLKETSP
jgi:4-amino-4-deoxy-L-arabinose transferase-like glycosyltransferase